MKLWSTLRAVAVWYKLDLGILWLGMGDSILIRGSMPNKAGKNPAGTL